jgi:hypothetical protein
MRSCLLVSALLFLILQCAVASAASVSIGVADGEGVMGSTVDVPVTANGVEGLGGLDFILAYDADVLTVVNVSAGSLNKGIIEANASVPGLLAVSTADPDGAGRHRALAVNTKEELIVEGAVPGRTFYPGNGIIRHAFDHGTGPSDRHRG